MKNLKITIIKDDKILDVVANKYDSDYGRGEGILLDIKSRDGFRAKFGGVISSLLAASQTRNLSGTMAKLGDYEKIIIVARAYSNVDFLSNENNEIIITTDNYRNLIIENASNSIVKEDIKRNLFKFFSERPTEYINGMGLYCSLYYEIPNIEKSLLLLKEIKDIEYKPDAGTWDSRGVEHWYKQYRLMPEIYKEMEAKLEQEQSRIRNPGNSTPSNIDEFDFFICHASEDKVPFVDDLASALVQQGFRVWYDDFIIKWGDSLREKIDEGLKSSRYGIVILSRDFIREDKKWAHRELNALFGQEMKRKKILPVWHNIDDNDISEFSPLLIDRKALSSSDGVDNIVEEARKLIEF